MPKIFIRDLKNIFPEIRNSPKNYDNLKFLRIE